MWYFVDGDNYLPSILAFLDARARGADVAIPCDERGHVSEGQRDERVLRRAACWSRPAKLYVSIAHTSALVEETIDRASKALAATRR
jgi:branched-subunit amino acid aminotransferase/4-amino-4-deoxychorismate lyase